MTIDALVAAQTAIDTNIQESVTELQAARAAVISLEAAVVAEIEALAASTKALEAANAAPVVVPVVYPEAQIDPNTGEPA